MNNFYPCLTTDICGVRHYILNFEEVNDCVKIAYTASHSEAMRLMNYNDMSILSCDALESQGCDVVTVNNLYEFFCIISSSYDEMRKMFGDKFDSWMFEHSL